MEEDHPDYLNYPHEEKPSRKNKSVIKMPDVSVVSVGMDDHDFRTAYSVLGAQRNLRILGVFARLATDYGKPHYVDLIPATWAHLMRDLEHSALVSVADLVREALPEPTPENLNRLRRT